MKILGRNFVFGRTIDEALKRAGPERKAASATVSTCSARRRGRIDDAARYAKAYRDALDAHRQRARPAASRAAPGISVKLSALHPRFEFTIADEAMAAILPVLARTWR